MTERLAITLRAKKLGVLLRDARTTTGKSKKECGEVIGVSGATIGSFENGRKSPSLPELEVLAYFLEVPIDHFWGSEIKSDDPEPVEDLQVDSIVAVRNKIIGAVLRQARADADLTLKSLSQSTGISTRMIRKYENGERYIPVPELDILTRALGISMEDLPEPKGTVGEWMVSQRALAGYLELPNDIQDFVSKPINIPYLHLAKRLSETSVEKLRAVAESLLEITL
jgi:transcriptional regulator with XRE-family HTH domain